jgi:hypothetical protein
MLASSQYVCLLRQELCARNASYAALQNLPHVSSHGEPPVIVYHPSACGRKHGNFISSSYRAIMCRPEWRRRLQKVHSQAKHALPGVEYVWRELDSSMSSDALLMNIFCYPGVTKRRELSLLMGADAKDLPEFGFRPFVPLLSGAKERTEVDMKLGSVLFEAKLTEADFQTQNPTTVEQYRDFGDVFDCSQLPRRDHDYVSYQLLRNILAAYALNLQFCVLLDVRRPDLLEQYYRVMRCVLSTDLRTRCKVLTWQELASCLPAALQRFLAIKYGIVFKPS